MNICSLQLHSEMPKNKIGDPIDIGHIKIIINTKIVKTNQLSVQLIKY